MEHRYFCIKCGASRTHDVLTKRMSSWLCDMCAYDPELLDVVRSEPKCDKHLRDLEMATIRFALVSDDAFSVYVWRELRH